MSVQVIPLPGPGSGWALFALRKNTLEATGDSDFCAVSKAQTGDQGWPVLLTLEVTVVVVNS